ncbi:MAG: hypothetical protein JO316_15205 [Abitibacteriaceae bacterium]|nr:hypothetical protein [Abditibacteriaceae bacterium]
MAIRVMHFGLGPIGCAVARQVANRRDFKIVGGIDVDPAKVGQDVGDVIGLERKVRAKVAADAAAALETLKPDIVVLCTQSSLSRVLPQIETILAAKVPIVSTTEELAYPTSVNRKWARRIDALAQEAGVAVLGTGVNPGFVMDALPITLTGVCERVDALEIDRIQDARTRRLPFQLKIGAGLTPEQFLEKVESGSVRHVGLAESISMIADAMGWKLEYITDDIAPKIASKPVSSEFLTVKRGQVCGIIQDGIGYISGQPLIKLHMEAYLGAPESYDAVRVTGSPNLSMKIVGGVAGDVATASIVVNSIPKVLVAMPGLRTMRDLPIPSYFGGKLLSG